MLNVVSIFESIEGEVNSHGQGAWSIFIRFGGCSAGCLYCDTQYACTPRAGDPYTVDSLFEDVESLASRSGINKITLTGGEPLEQDREELTDLITMLSNHGYDISIETNGVHDVAWIGDIDPIESVYHPEICVVMDYKLPSAGMINRLMDLNRYLVLEHTDFVKFVICNKEDFSKAMEIVERLRALKCEARMYFSPAGKLCKPYDLFTWMKDSACPEFGVGYNLQIHKHIFPNDDWRLEEK